MKEFTDHDIERIEELIDNGSETEARTELDRKSVV